MPARVLRTPSRAEPDGSRIRGALRLRVWALEVLNGRPGPAPAASEAAWRLFASAERCALPLDRAGFKLPREVMDLEVQRNLSARALLRRLEQALATLGARGVLLKGGVPLACDLPPLDVRDLDVLVSPEAVAPLADLLAAGGGGEGRDADEALAVDAPGGWERAVRCMPGSIPVELHVAVPFLLEGVDPWHGVRATGFGHLLLPAPGTHLWHVLAHSVIHHPERRGVIRDLLLARTAAEACSEDDLGQVLRAVAAHPRRVLLERTLAAARPTERPGADAFASEAALRYEVLNRYLSGPRLRPWFLAAAFGLLEGGGDYRGLWAGSARSAWGEGVGPRLPRFLWRGAQLAAVTPLSWRAVRAARSHGAARAGDFSGAPPR